MNVSDERAHVANKLQLQTITHFILHVRVRFRVWGLGLMPDGQQTARAATRAVARAAALTARHQGPGRSHADFEKKFLGESDLQN